MPCRGPDQDEVRTANHHGELYQLIIDLHVAMATNRENPFTSEFISECHKNLNATKQAYSTRMFFDRATAVLCDIVREFTPEQQDRYLYNGRDTLNVRLNFWKIQHDKLDQAREKQEAFREAERQAKKAAQDAYDRTFKSTMTQLTGGII